MATIATLFTPLAANVNRSGTLLIVLRILVGFSSVSIYVILGDAVSIVDFNK